MNSVMTKTQLQKRNERRQKRENLVEEDID